MQQPYLPGRETVHMAEGKIGYMAELIQEPSSIQISLEGRVEWRGNRWLGHKERNK